MRLDYLTRVLNGQRREKKEATKSKSSNAKEARILKRKKRWKEKVEEAKKRKKKRKKENEAKSGDGETGGGGDDEEDENEEDEEDVAAWAQYDLHPLLLKAIRKLRFTSPTPIQEKVLHPAIKGRMDIVGAAETGSGKTLAFGLPILQRLMQDKEEEKWYEEYADKEKPGKGKKHLRALIVTPTRELALQVAKMLADVAIYTGIQIAAIVGGMSKQKQERVLKKQPEIIVATPGRLWELFRDGEKHLTSLERLTFLTLDEADRMVERGHFKELESVIKSIPEPPETRRIARSAKLTKRKQPMAATKVVSNDSKTKKKGDEEEEDDDDEKENDEENEPAADNRIMARDRQTFVFSATLTVPDEVKYKLDRKKPQASSKKVNNGKKKDGGGSGGASPLDRSRSGTPANGSNYSNQQHQMNNQNLLGPLMQSPVLATPNNDNNNNALIGGSGEVNSNGPGWLTPGSVSTPDGFMNNNNGVQTPGAYGNYRSRSPNTVSQITSADGRSVRVNDYSVQENRMF